LAPIQQGVGVLDALDGGEEQPLFREVLAAVLLRTVTMLFPGKSPGPLIVEVSY
jgi:hypothetical protein